MRCRYCNIALAPLRSLANDEFCCDEHRVAFVDEQAQQAALPEEIPEPLVPIAPVAPKVSAEPRVSAALRMLRLRFAPPPPPPPTAPPIALEAEPVSAESELELPTLQQSLERPVEQLDALAESYASESTEGLAEQPYQAAEDLDQIAQDDTEPDQSLETSNDTHRHPPLETAGSWRWIRTAWKGAPRDLKLITVALPLVAALAVTGSFPKVPIKTVAPAQVAQVEKVVNEQWKNLNQTISNRAAISYADDFRSGLDAWESRSNLTTSWSYDAVGFVRPGPLAVFKPTLDLVDYRFEFLGEIDQKAMGWVVHAEDLDNYYAMKLMVVKPGPLPLVDLVHYAVINGKEGPHVRKPLPMTVRADMLYRVLVDTRGGDFTIMVQGQVVDFWTDHRLQHGGVGFFASRGERARLRWVEVSHQYDALGRVCAYLAPYGIEGRNGFFN
jgi:hypothetical protein